MRKHQVCVAVTGTHTHTLSRVWIFLFVRLSLHHSATLGTTEGPGLLLQPFTEL